MRRLFAVAFAALCVAAPGEAQTPPDPESGTLVFRDTFTEAENHNECAVEVSQHAPDLGGQWIVSENTTNDPRNRWKAASGRDWLSPCGSPVGERISYYIVPAVSLSRDYVMRFQLDDAISSSKSVFGGYLLRRTSVDTFYALGMRPEGYTLSCSPGTSCNKGPDAYLFKWVNGLKTILVQCDCDFDGDAGTGDTVEFGVQGDFIWATRNGVVVMSVHDSSITEAGFPGMFAGQYLDLTDHNKQDSGWATDDLEIWDLNGTGGPPPDPDPGPAPTTDVTVEGVCGRSTFQVDLAGPAATLPADAEAGCRVTVTKQ